MPVYGNILQNYEKILRILFFHAFVDTAIPKAGICSQVRQIFLNCACLKENHMPVKVIIKRREAGEAAAGIRERGQNLGFVPTMGALHKGHLSLIGRSVRENDATVVSIFVNPAQFNEQKDLEDYPGDLERDLEILEAYGPDFVFAPTVEEMYPEEDTRVFDLCHLDKVLEGKFRPGHFNGVAKAVSNLIDILKPDRAYFGSKDLQQLAVIRKLGEQLNWSAEIIGCPIIREPDGLAMSSRNQLLTGEQRQTALIIPRTLFRVRDLGRSENTPRIKAFVRERFREQPGIRLEYFEIVDEHSFHPVRNPAKHPGAAACIAARVGAVRLIDNVKFSY